MRTSYRRLAAYTKTRVIFSLSKNRHFTGDEGFLNYEFTGVGTDGIEAGSEIAAADASVTTTTAAAPPEVDYGSESLRVHWSDRVRKSGTTRL